MTHQYYFAATLPSLQFGMEPPISGDEFITRAARYLPEGELEILSAVSLAPVPEEAGSSPSPLLRRYAAWSSSLRLELARLRAEHAGRDFEAGALADVPRDAGAVAAARSAFAAASPLDGELELEGRRWAFVDGLSPIQTFDFDGLCAWRLKLLILERLSLLTTERGELGYRAVYSAIIAAYEGREDGAHTSS